MHALNLFITAFFRLTFCGYTKLARQPCAKRTYFASEASHLLLPATICLQCGAARGTSSSPRPESARAQREHKDRAPQALGRGAERVSRLLDEVPPRTATNSGRSIAARQTSRCKPCRARRHTSIHQRIATDRVRVPARRRGPALPAIVYLAFAKKRP